MRQKGTSAITKSIAAILSHLFDTYVHLTSDDLKAAEEKVQIYFWNIAEPPNVFYKLIEDLEDIAEAAALPKSTAQLINFGLDVIRKTGEFEKYLAKWNKKDSNDKTWDNFKKHFNEAYWELRQVRGPTIKNTPFHQAHSLVEKISDDFNKMRAEVLHTITTSTPTVPTNPTLSEMSTITNNNFSANNMSNATDTNLHQLIAQLQQQIEHLQQNSNATSATTQRKPNRRKNVSKYCWTHGACAHSSEECTNRKPGHVPTATFENKQGGSLYYCPRNNNDA